MRDFNALDESRCKSETYLQNSIKSFYLVCTLTFLPSQFHSLFLSQMEVNLKIKEFSREKAGFRAIHTENDADMFISWRRTN